MKHAKLSKLGSILGHEVANEKSSNRKTTPTQPQQKLGKLKKEQIEKVRKVKLLTRETQNGDTIMAKQTVEENV